MPFAGLWDALKKDGRVLYLGRCAKAWDYKSARGFSHFTRAASFPGGGAGSRQKKLRCQGAQSLDLCRHSSIGESSRFVIGRFQVRILVAALWHSRFLHGGHLLLNGAGRWSSRSSSPSARPSRHWRIVLGLDLGARLCIGVSCRCIKGGLFF